MEPRSGTGAVATGEVLVQQWATSLAAIDHPPSTIRVYTTDAASWLLFLKVQGVPLAEAKLKHAEAWIMQLRALELKPRTVQRRVSSCRQFHRWARGREQLPNHPFQDLGRIRAQHRLPRFLEEGQVTKVLDAGAAVSGRKKSLAPRNVAILEAFYATGARLGELHGLNLAHVSFDGGTVLLFGKGRKERLVPIGVPALAAIKAYLPWREEALKSKGRFYEEALFVSERGTRLSRDSIQEVVEKAGAKVGLDVHAHMFRHSYGTHLVEHGVALEDVQDLMGHLWIQTTRGYVHTAVGRLKAIYEKGHPRA